MRTIPIALQASLDSGSSTLAWGITIDRADGTRFAYCSCDRPKRIDSDTLCMPGFDVASLVMSASLNVDDTEIRVIDGFVTRDQVASGSWEGAAFSIFRFNWRNPTGGIDVRMTGRLANLRPDGPAIVAELRDIRQALQQDVTPVMQPTCRYRLGDEKCGVALHDFTYPVEVTAVASQTSFTDSARVEPADWFTEGEIVWVTGSNAGLRSKVRTFSAGVFALAAPAFYPIEIGDTADVIAGCMKRRTEDCAEKFDNVLNFGGEPDKPTVDSITAPATYEEGP